jgi:transcriptional regulator with XRE-family HTH domain
MARTALTGARIRAYRLDRGMQQAELARACGISASYLNLIEHNRRRIGGALLLRIAAALGVDASRLSGGAESGVSAAMDAAAAAMPAAGAERDRAEDLAVRFPGWGRLIDTQHQEIRRLTEVIERLDDRLTHDPFLSASMHNVLSSVTAIRSASAILAQGGEIEPEWQARFHRNIYEDSQRLADATETLVHYLDTDPAVGAAGALPQDDLDGWLAERRWRIGPLEDDPAADLDMLLDGEESFASPSVRQLARRYMERYARDAAAVPEARLAEAVAEEGTDLAGLARRLGADLPTVFRRLAALDPDQTPGTFGFGLVGCDASGALIFRKPLPGFDLPRYSAGCALWPLFEALRRPMEPIRRPMVLAGRDEVAVEALAIAEIRYPEGFGRPAAVEAWMLIWPAPGVRQEAEPVGTSCRICARADCMARREPSVFARGGGARDAL